MLFDDNISSTSSAEYLESPHEARRKELMRKLEKQGMKNAATKPGADLKDLKLALLRGQVDKKEEKAVTSKEEQKAGATATKTREQEIASEKLTAQGVQDAKAQQALRDDEVQSEDA